MGFCNFAIRIGSRAVFDIITSAPKESRFRKGKDFCQWQRLILNNGKEMYSSA